MNLRKGISPVIATVIIVAVALAIAIAAVGWVMGIWGSVTGGTEILKIMPDSKLNSTGTLTLHVKNEGGATASIIKVEVVGVNTTTEFTQEGAGSTNTITVSAGTDVTFTANIGTTLTAGATYTIKVYTAAGNVYSTQLVAE